MIKKIAVLLLLTLSGLIALIILPFKIAYTIACENEMSIRNYTSKK